MSSLQLNQESAVASMPMSQSEQLYNSQQAHAQINSGSSPSLAQSGHHVQTMSNIHQLDHVQYHHQNSQFVNQIPTDPFAQAALENAMMYVPEISDSPRGSALTQQNQEPSQVVPNVSSNIQPDGEVEMFEDIVANTNPYLAALPDANLYITHNVNYFDSKRNLLRASNSHHDFYALEKNIASEVGSQADQIIDFNDYELDLDDNYSDFSYSEADEEMLQLFNPDSAAWPNSNPYAMAASRRRRLPKLNCTLRQINDRGLEQEEADKVSQAENQSVRNIQLHSLMNPAERSECCCADDDFKDIGLDSTMSISIYDQGGPTSRPMRRLVSEREGNEINSHRAEGLPYKDLNSKKRKDHRSLGRQHVSRNALSQMNYKDLQDEQDMQWEYGLEADEENFEKMMMLQEDEDSQFQQGVLQLNRHKSAIEKGRFGDSTSYISKSNQKPDLRKKKSLAVNFREDLNVEACNTALKTPQQNAMNSFIQEENKFLIPMPQTRFEAAMPHEQDKVETENISKDTDPAKILGYYKIDILKKQQMDSQFGTFDQAVAKQPKRNYQNPRQIMNSNIQYQFLKYNGFRPMNVGQHCNEDKVEDYGILRPQQEQEDPRLANYLAATDNQQQTRWAGASFTLPNYNCNWQLGALHQGYEQQVLDGYQQQQAVEFEQTQQSLNQQIQISDDYSDRYRQRPQNIAQKIKFLDQIEIDDDVNNNYLMLAKQKESILQSGIKNILKNGSKKISKEPKIEVKALKLKNKSKRVDQNKRVTTGKVPANDKENYIQKEVSGQSIDEKPQVELKSFSHEKQQSREEPAEVFKFEEEFIQSGGDSSAFKNELNQLSQRIHQHYQQPASPPPADENNQIECGSPERSKMMLSSESLKISIPQTSQQNEAAVNDEEESEEASETVAQMQNRKKKCRTQKTKYYQNFDFFFKRSCFRTMTEFYKDKFNCFHKKRLTKMKQEQPVAWNKYMKNGGIKSLSKEQMYVIVQGFIDHIFGKDILSNNTALTLHQKKLITLRVMMILFSHRHTKRDTFIEQAQQEAVESGEKALSIDFSTIRDVMYKYSKKAEEKYFQCETESFMFAAFALSDEGVRFLKEKPDNCKDQEKLNRILRDLNSLKDQALLSLSMMSQGKVLKVNTEGSSEAQGTAELGNSDSQCEVQKTSLQPQCDLQVGTFLFKELRKMTKNML